MIAFPARCIPICALAVLGAACGGGGGGDAESQPTPVVAVQTAIVQARPFTETFGTIGTVVGRPGHVASLGAPTATRVSRVYVSEGARVAAGQPLVELDRTAIDAAAQAAETALTSAQQAYERADRLNREGVSPRKDVEQAASDVAKARSEAVAARRAAQLAVLRSPIAGVVTRLTAVLGASVDVNQPLVEVADPGALDLVFTVTPSEAARVKVNASVKLAAGQNAGGEALGTGTVTQISAAVDSATRGVPVRVHAPSSRRALRIGETIFGQIVVGTRPNAIAVPAAALVPDGEGFKVFIVDAENIAHEQPVTVGARTDSTAEITEGLKGGERVVTYGAYGVEDSVKVTTASAAKAKTPAETAAHP
ncbi:MAG TPA: efflux RND transporter periplasmic adaptor subunit [Gemmatimonadaceae bacterium]|jgi:RND family efflux transporter MFP subunit|nr:efflux RND transporter periplasmic adaptor subunit [Gemmatimonadaceae bacterium]